MARNSLGYGNHYRYGDYQVDDSCGWCWVVGTLCAVVVAVLFYFGHKWNKEEDRLDAITPVVYSIPRGHVTSVNRCYSGKHYYNCTITMSNGDRWETDITNWPDEFFTPGTELHWEIWTQEYRQKQFLCNTTKCYAMNRFEKGDEDYSEVFAKGN